MSDARSPAPSLSIALRAASRARVHRSPYPMLYDVSTRIATSRAPFCVAAASESRRKNGRANASTINAIAARRRRSSARWRMRLRRTDLYGIRRRNMSDGNSTTLFFSRWIRWIRIGTANAARPASTRGATRPISANSSQPLPRGQIVEECRVERGGRIDQGVVDAQLRALRRERLAVLADE